MINDLELMKSLLVYGECCSYKNYKASSTTMMLLAKRLEKLNLPRLSPRPSF